MSEEPVMTRRRRYARAFAVGVLPWALLMLPATLAAGGPSGLLFALSPMSLLAYPLLDVSTLAFQVGAVIGALLLLVALAELCRPDSAILPLFGGASFLGAALLMALMRG